MSFNNPQHVNSGISEHLISEKIDHRIPEMAENLKSLHKNHKINVE
jgi:hypothetical protein